VIKRAEQKTPQCLACWPVKTLNPKALEIPPEWKSSKTRGNEAVMFGLAGAVDIGSPKIKPALKGRG
jgi:hypothetical protein